MSMPIPMARVADAGVARAEAEATRHRTEAGKAIVATVFRGIVPLAVYGIALGATAVVTQTTEPSLHLAGLLVIWICSTLFNIATVLAGLLEKQRFNLRRLIGDESLQLEPGEAKKLMHSIQE